MGVLLSSPAAAVTQMMLNQGYLPDAGLGKHLQGHVQPIQAQGNPGRQGLGFPGSSSQPFP